jgi:hypothetical protein
VEALGGRVTLREPKITCNPGDRRAELELARCESKGKRIKQWLEGAGYFLFALEKPAKDGGGIRPIRPLCGQ